MAFFLLFHFDAFGVCQGWDFLFWPSLGISFVFSRVTVNWLLFIVLVSLYARFQKLAILMISFRAQMFKASLAWRAREEVNLLSVL